MTFDDNVSDGDLSNSLVSLGAQSRFDEKEFWPHGCTEGIFTRDSISKALKVNANEPNELVDFILDKSRTTFAILLHCAFDRAHLRQAMDHLKDIKMDDSKLPITYDDLMHHIFDPSPTNIEDKSPWTIFGVKNFCINQWAFIAPVFETCNKVLNLHRNAIFPFIKSSSHGSSGAFGQVYEVTIHDAHLKGVLIVRFSKSYLKPSLSPHPVG